MENGFFTCKRIETTFILKTFTFSFMLKIRLDGTWKRPTGIILHIFLSKEIHNTSSFPGTFPTRPPNSRQGTSRTGTREWVFSIEVLRFFSSPLNNSELTQQDGEGNKTANLVWQAWQQFCLKKRHVCHTQAFCRPLLSAVLLRKLTYATECTWICGTLTSPPYSSVIGWGRCTNDLLDGIGWLETTLRPRRKPSKGSGSAAK